MQEKSIFNLYLEIVSELQNQEVKERIEMYEKEHKELKERLK